MKFHKIKIQLNFVKTKYSFKWTNCLSKTPALNLCDKTWFRGNHFHFQVKQNTLPSSHQTVHKLASKIYKIFTDKITSSLAITYQNNSYFKVFQPQGSFFFHVGNGVLLCKSIFFPSPCRPLVFPRITYTDSDFAINIFFSFYAYCSSIALSLAPPQMCCLPKCSSNGS